MRQPQLQVARPDGRCKRNRQAYQGQNACWGRPAAARKGLKGHNPADGVAKERDNCMGMAEGDASEGPPKKARLPTAYCSGQGRVLFPKV
jgi:hypothetical protein